MNPFDFGSHPSTLIEKLERNMCAVLNLISFQNVTDFGQGLSCRRTNP